MDTTDPDIAFDENDVCGHCHNYDAILESEIFYDEEGAARLRDLVSTIKQTGEGKRYDCVVGISGGADSSFMVYKVKDLGLRPLAVHLDNGWDSELAVNNIEQLLNQLDIDLHTYVLDWEEFRDLQLAFLKASTPDSEIPTDHAIIAALYKVASKYGIKYIITGHNNITEGYAVPAWSQGHYDWGYIKGLHRRFGSGRRLRSFPNLGFLNFFWYKVIRGIRMIRIMNYIPYDKPEAVEFLTAEYNWKPYPTKHFESFYTSFYQGVVLPQKFGYDKRRMHLSALISSGTISREQALEEMENPPYPLERIEPDREYVAKKLGISVEDFEAIMDTEPRSFWDYPSYKKLPLMKQGWLLRLYRRFSRR